MEQYEKTWIDLIHEYCQDDINLINKVTKTMNNEKISSLESGIDAVRIQSFIIGSVSSSGAVSFAENPVLQGNAASARGECKRLAKLTPGKLFIFVRLSGGELVPTATISV